jgi:uncharacterized protein (TIGR00288 family)
MSATNMLLIDADNVSADVIEQAVALLLERDGALHVRRAYGNAEAALKHQALFKRLGIRPMVNLATGKNSTDIALAVDAVDLVLAERPAMVAIASSDSDFAPLVAKLRELGCTVLGLGQQGKVGEDTAALYDEFVALEHRRAAAKKAPARKKAEKATRADKPAKGEKSSRAVKPAPAPALPEAVVRVVEAVPELAAGEPVQLGVVAEKLRSLGLLGKSVSSAKLFQKHPEHFELQPARQPNRVLFRTGAGAEPALKSPGKP